MLLASPKIYYCNICGGNSGEKAFYNRVNSRCAECHRESVKLNRSAKIEYYRAYDAKRFKEQPQRKACNALYANTTRGKEVMAKSREKWEVLNRVKRNAHIKLGNAVRDGLVKKPDTCSVCGNNAARIHGHHHDYSKPLDVTWVCPPCHASLHR